MSIQDPGRIIKTTVYLDAADYERLKRMARAEGRTAAELVQAAVAEYARRQPDGVRPRSLRAGRSRQGDLAERAEELLDDLGRDERSSRTRVR